MQTKETLKTMKDNMIIWAMKHLGNRSISAGALTL